MITGRIAAAYRNAEISTKITVTYAACFIALLIITNAVINFDSGCERNTRPKFDTYAKFNTRAK